MSDAPNSPPPSGSPAPRTRAEEDSPSPNPNPVDEPAATVTPTLPRVRGAFIFGLVAATFGVMMAIILPTAFSLSVVLERIAPGREQMLGGIAAAGALAGMLSGPAAGVWSDRTRSRHGRRRPFLLGGLVVGVAGSVVLAFAGNVGMLYAGWIVANLGLGTSVAALLNIQADRLPEEQRGRVAGLTGFAGMTAPVLGVALASALGGDQRMLFLVPGAVATVCIVAFGLLMKDPDTRDHAQVPLSFGTVAAKYVFDPRKHPAFAWNWLGRIVFFMGISGSTTFTTFFFAQRLDMPVHEVAGVVASLSVLGIGGGIIGNIGSGYLSDKVKRRRVFILAGAMAIAAGSVVTALAGGVLGIAVGLLITNFGIGVFSAVDQAIVLDVLPERDTDAGRYMALMAFSQGIPNILAPLIAGYVITIGAGEGAKNYTLLFLLTGAFALIGAAIIHTKVKSVR
ncbi:MFS transporter [Streptomyces fractus]|uniref:MFS transporter n=1 Tax=Streptomyces fractus TaxID=641806 RepID=UPI003CE7EA4E